MDGCGELVPLLEQAVEDNPGRARLPRDPRARAEPRPRAARRRAALLEQAVALALRRLPYDVTWLAVACIYAQVSARLEHVAAAAALYRMLEPWRGQIAFPAFGVWGPVALYLGSLALVLGDVRPPQRHLSEATRGRDPGGGADLGGARQPAGCPAQLAESAR